MANRFRESHAPTGTICNASQRDDFSWDRPHASTVVCDRLACQILADQYIRAFTGEPGVYRSFAETQAREVSRD